MSGSWQNLAMARGLEATNGYNPLRIGSYDRLVSPGETTHIVDQRLFPASFDGYDCALARELGLEYVVLGRPIEEVPHLARRPVSDVLLAGPKVWIYRLRRRPSRASSSSSACRWRTRTRRSGPGSYGVNPAGETAQIDDDTAPLARLLADRAAGADSELGAHPLLASRSLEIEVESDQPGIAHRCTRSTIPAGSPRSTGKPARIAARQCAVPRRGGERGAPRRRVPLRAVLARQPAQCVHGAVCRPPLSDRTCSREIGVASSANDRLLEAAADGSLEAVEEALRQGADIDARREFGDTALNLAAEHGHKDVVQCLLDKGADIHNLGGADKTPIMNAAFAGNIGIVRLLLEKGARVTDDLLASVQLKVGILEENAELGMVRPEAVEAWKRFLDMLAAARQERGQ